MSDEILREMCDKNYHQLLPLIAEKMQKEKEQKDKLNAVKARLIYGEESGIKIRSREESHYSESKDTNCFDQEPSKKARRQVIPEAHHRTLVFQKTQAAIDSIQPRRQSPRAKRTEVETRRHQQRQTPSRTTSQYSESEDSEGGHWKSRSRRQKSNTYEDDLYQPWTCEERNPFTLRIRHFSLPRTRMPSHVKTYDGSGDPEDHLKLFQSAAKTEGWAMPTWCHMFNSTLTGNARVWFDKLPKESIDSYEDLRTAFRENYLQQTKHIKDPVEIHHIKQRDGESTEDFMERYKAEVLDVEGAPECMRISGFMHGITHPGLIKRLYERIPRSVDEMYRMTTSFLQGEVAALSHGRRKASSSWKPSEGGDKPTFKKGFKNKQRPDRKPDRFSLLTKTPKEIFALEKGKFKAPPPMSGQAKDYPELLSGDSNVFPQLCGETRRKADESSKSKLGGHFVLGYPLGKGAMISGPSIQPPTAKQVLEEKIKIAIHPEYPEQTVAIGSTLTEKGRKELCALLKQNLDIFAWKPADMTGVPRNIAEHRLNIREGYSQSGKREQGEHARKRIKQS
ncbi:reverse transcriptase domain-containing protein [Tanacetum coccineum]|uniref:Reverse transcriptase domain-containing protein n=1 Tax=Tanacetum coccineum TaxID=301880 RepID=A0ABQ5J2X7_9ASTR